MWFTHNCLCPSIFFPPSLPPSLSHSPAKWIFRLHFSPDISHTTIRIANETATIRSRQVSFFNQLANLFASLSWDSQLLHIDICCYLWLLLLLLLLLLRFQWFEIIYLECSRNAVLKATFGIGYNYASERDLPTVAKVYLKSREKNYASLWCTRRPLIIHLFTVFSIKLLFHLTCIFHFFRNFDGEFSNVLLCDDFAFQPDHSKALEGFELH